MAELIVFYGMLSLAVAIGVLYSLHLYRKSRARENRHK